LISLDGEDSSVEGNDFSGPEKGLDERDLFLIKDDVLCKGVCGGAVLLSGMEYISSGRGQALLSFNIVPFNPPAASHEHTIVYNITPTAVLTISNVAGCWVTI
jgi:hypothetical protein